MGKKRRARQGREYWTQVIAKFERLRLSQAAFCQREKLNVGTFRTWLYRLRAEEEGDSPVFVEVIERAKAAPQPCVVVVGSARIEFRQTPDAVYLAELLTSLGLSAG